MIFANEGGWFWFLLLMATIAVQFWQFRSQMKRYSPYMKGGPARLKKALLHCFAPAWPMLLYLFFVDSQRLVAALGDYYYLPLAVVATYGAAWYVSFFIGPLYKLHQDLLDAGELAYKAKLAQKEHA
jgi:hypothetical protein